PGVIMLPIERLTGVPAAPGTDQRDGRAEVIDEAFLAGDEPGAPPPDDALVPAGEAPAGGAPADAGDDEPLDRRAPHRALEEEPPDDPGPGRRDGPKTLPPEDAVELPPTAAAPGEAIRPAMVLGRRRSDVDILAEAA